MLKATAGKPLATTITGSLPRPSWFTENLRGRAFSAALGDLPFREQYIDAVATFVSDQTRAGLDVLTDGDARFDMDLGGRSWRGYVLERLDGMAAPKQLLQPWESMVEQAAGSILQEVSEARLSPRVIGELHGGTLEYARLWRVAQRMSDRPLKFGACSGQVAEAGLVNEFYASREALIAALAKVMNAEFHNLADAGCQVIQVEEPLIHQVASAPRGGLDADFYLKAFNDEIAGLRAKTEVWVHTCFGNPAAQKIDVAGSYRAALPYLNELDADVLTFETASDDGAALEAIGETIAPDKRICIGVVSHRTLQIETADQVAAFIRKALRYIAPERLIVGTDCGFGRQGMSRLHAFHKMVSIVRGTNIVKRELGLPESRCLAADPRYALG